MSVLGRVVVGALGLAGLIHCYLAWRSGRAPLMIGEADAKYWGQRWPFHRVASLLALTGFSAMFVFASIFR
ncbi:MAG: hypothetical protein WCC60_23900 [Ilumatobacteraceae bacterium]